jgi:hypothetical protein
MAFYWIFNKVHFKKWYKKVYLAVLDCMMLNSLIAWNLSVNELKRSGRRHLKRHEFFQYIAQSMLNYRERTGNGPTTPEQIRESTSHLFVGDTVHIPTQASSRHIRCIVCRLEWHWKAKELGQGGMSSGVGTCKCCDISAHTAMPRSSNRKIHQLPIFRNLTCFQIAHTPEGLDLFRRVQSGKGSFQVNYKNPIYLELRKAHGLPIERTNKKAKTNSDSDADADDTTMAEASQNTEI